MHKALIVARREYLSTVRRKSFLIVTFAMPLFFMLLMAFSAGGALLASRSAGSNDKPVGIVDEAGILKLQLLDRVRASFRSEKSVELEGLPESVRKYAEAESSSEERRIQIIPFESRSAAKEAFLKKELRGYYIIPSGFLRSGQIELEIRKGGIMRDDMPARWLVLRWVQASLIEGRLEGDLAQRAWMPANIKATILTETGSTSKSGKALDFMMPYFFTILFMISIIGSAGYLLQGVAEEKENRVMEVLLSSVTPNQLLTGKVLGLGAAGLTQLFAWIVIAVAPAAYMIPSLQLRWGQLLVALIYFLLGFFLFGTLMGGTGALYSNYRESQQSSVIWTMSAVSPMFVMVPLLSEPNGVLARVLSYFPLTAPVTMMLRVSAAKVPMWDIGLSICILAGSLFLFLRLGGKLFRVGILMYGKRPSLVEIVRWVKAA